MRKWLIILILIPALAACSLSGSSDESPVDGEEQIAEATSPPDATATEQLAATRTVFPTSLPIPNQTTENQNNTSNSTSQQTTQSQSFTFDSPSIQAPTGDEQVMTLSLDSGVVGDGANLLGLQIDQFAQNPASPNRFSVIDAAGMLYVTDRGGANAFRIEDGPYTRFPATSRVENNAAAVESAWSPNGEYLAFIVNGDRQAADGMWYFQPGQFAPLQLLVDCPSEGFIGCNIVQPPDNFPLWESQELYWSPSSDSILVNVNLPGQGRRGMIVNPITRAERVRDRRPPVILYDYGTWANDGRIVASGRNPDSAVVIALIDASGNLSESVYNAGANGLWMGWAAQSPDGDIYALGTPGGANGAQGALAIYDMQGTALTLPIGDGFPQRVEWSPDRRAVLLVVNGRQFVATLDGGITEITPQTGGKPVNWIE